MLIYYAGADSVGKWDWRYFLRRVGRPAPYLHTFAQLAGQTQGVGGKQRWVMKFVLGERRGKGG